jgi:hypothetical protein
MAAVFIAAGGGAAGDRSCEEGRCCSCRSGSLRSPGYAGGAFAVCEELPGRAARRCRQFVSPRIRVALARSRVPAPPPGGRPK